MCRREGGGREGEGGRREGEGGEGGWREGEGGRRERGREGEGGRKGREEERGRRSIKQPSRKPCTEVHPYVVVGMMSSSHYHHQ